MGGQIIGELDRVIVDATAAAKDRVGLVVLGDDEIVLTVAAIQGIGADPARQSVVARIAEQRVIACAANDAVVAVAAIDRVITRTFGIKGADDVIARPAKGYVIACVAVQGFAPRPTGQRVIANAAEQGGVAGVAGQRVIASAAIDGVIASARGDDVIAAAAVNQVIASACVDDVTAVCGRQGGKSNIRDIDILAAGRVVVVVDFDVMDRPRNRHQNRSRSLTGVGRAIPGRNRCPGRCRAVHDCIIAGRWLRQDDDHHVAIDVPGADCDEIAVRALINVVDPERDIRYLI